MNSFRNAFAISVLMVLPASYISAQAPASNKKTAPSRTAPSSKKRSTQKSTAAPKQTWRTRQMQPTEQRYREIQAALANKGYLHGEPTGIWNQDSVDALRRFQEDQKLAPTGKLDSLSLIALGLGPKRETVAAPPPTAPPPSTSSAPGN